MENRELRIGNFVMTGLGSYEMVCDILCDSVNTVGGTRLYDDIDPIPLSAEILEKAGFICLNYETHKKYITGEFCIIQYPNDEFTFMWNGQVVYIKSVHQLQNLYFALTGEELPVNP